MTLVHSSTSTVEFELVETVGSGQVFRARITANTRGAAIQAALRLMKIRGRTGSSYEVVGITTTVDVLKRWEGSK